MLAVAQSHEEGTPLRQYDEYVIDSPRRTSSASTPKLSSLTHQRSVSTGLESPQTQVSEEAQDDVFWDEKSVTEQSFTEESVTEQSVTEQSVTEESVTEQSVTEQSVKEQSVKEQSVKEESVTEESVTEESVTEESVTEQSVTEQSVTEQSVTEQSVKEESVTEQSVTEESVTEESVTEQNVKEESSESVTGTSEITVDTSSSAVGNCSEVSEGEIIIYESESEGEVDLGYKEKLSTEAVKLSSEEGARVVKSQILLSAHDTHKLADEVQTSAFIMSPEYV